MSDAAALDTTYAWEPLSGLLDDGLATLVRQHWEEVGVHKDKMPLDCDWERYQALEDGKILKILAARRDDVLVGYNSFMVLPHLHYATTVHALGDAIFVPRALRHTGIGVELIDRAERDLTAQHAPGWVRIVYHDKAHLEYLGPVLRKRGYGHIEAIYDKMVRA